MNVSSPNKELTLAIVGNPNSGKTTLFNQLTGLRQKVGNYPGVTVEKKVGALSINGREIQLYDLPGTYSLNPRSEDEKIASEVILGKRPHVPPMQGVLCVVDSTCLERNLYLVLQMIETGKPTAVLLNMSDEMERRGAEINKDRLSQILNVPVFSVSATKGTGLREVTSLLENWTKNPPLGRNYKPEEQDQTEAIRQRRNKAKEICIQVLKKSPTPHSPSNKIDRIVLHRVWGPAIFVGVVMVVFQAIFSWAQPFMDLIDGGFGSLSAMATRILPEGLLSSFISEAVIAGVGSVVVFLPQILIVFFFIALLEQSGYMARAAMVMDRFFRKVGLQGKSFLPLISSYACAVPGIMAARTIENNRDRIATILVAPFMTCSARLPVYALLIAAFIPDKIIIKGFLGYRSLTLLGLYILGFLAALFTAFLLKSSILKSDRVPFILDIPPYRLPSLKTILLLMWDRSKIFLKRASTIIFGTTVVLWILISFPRTDGPDQVEQSYAGQIGHAIEPLIQPLGFNWKIGVGLLAAQAAREVIVSSLGTIYKVDEADESDSRLQDALKADLTPLAAVSLLIFFVFAMQCMSTLAITRRETNGWKVPAFMFFYMNAYAYVASLIVYQGGRFLGY